MLCSGDLLVILRFVNSVLKSGVCATFIPLDIQQLLLWVCVHCNLLVLLSNMLYMQTPVFLR